MKAICELATMKCYYHTVAKYKEENAEQFLWMSKDKKFWVEYSGIVPPGCRYFPDGHCGERN